MSTVDLPPTMYATRSSLLAYKVSFQDSFSIANGNTNLRIDSFSTENFFKLDLKKVRAHFIFTLFQFLAGQDIPIYFFMFLKKVPNRHVPSHCACGKVHIF